MAKKKSVSKSSRKVAKKSSRKSLKSSSRSSKKSVRSSRSSRSYSNVNVPTGVKFIAAIFYVVAIVNVVGAVLMLIGGLAGQGIIESFGVDKLIELFPNLTPEGVQVAVSLTPWLVLGALLMFALAVLEFYVGRDLFQAKNWARYTALIFVALGMISALSSLSTSYVTSSLVSFLVYTAVGAYLWLNKDVRAVFRN